MGLRYFSLFRSLRAKVRSIPGLQSFQLPRVLIADDDLAIGELVSQYLIHDGFPAVAVSQPERIVDEVRRWKPHVIILDIMMPRVSGFDVLKELQTEIRRGGLIVFMMTARQAMDDVERALNLGAKDYLVKPVRLNELSIRLRDY